MGPANAQSAHTHTHTSRVSRTHTVGLLSMCVFVVVSVLHTAGQHMEDSIMAAYIALLIGTLIQHKQVTHSLTHCYICISSRLSTLI